MSFIRNSFELGMSGKANASGKSGKSLLGQLGFGGGSETDTNADTNSVKSSTEITSSKSERSDIDDELAALEAEAMDNGDGATSIFMKKMNLFLKRQAKAFVRNFIDYGPPYTKKGFDPALINECARPNINLYELHKLLNQRLNPNIADPEDLYYTPTHWIARNSHYLAMKMLKRAGAQLNVTTEMGNTPLELCVMMMQPPDKRKEQVNLVIYMLENGANPNNIDKGGYSAIDHAAANQDAEMIAILLDFGANVIRDNQILVAKRQPILKNVHNPECFKLLYERLLIEEGEAERRRIERAKANQVVVDVKRHEKLFKALDKKKEKRLQREAEREAAERKGEVESERLDKIQADMERNLKARAVSKAEHNGIWQKDDAGHWEFHSKVHQAKNANILYAENKKIMMDVYERNKIDKYSDNWRQITVDGELEMPWTKADPFILPDIRLQLQQQEERRRLGSAGGLDGSDTASRTVISRDGQATVDLEYRDENDEELDGEDLDDMLAALED